jgi:hypothetical protein
MRGVAKIKNISFSIREKSFHFIGNRINLLLESSASVTLDRILTERRNGKHIGIGNAWVHIFEGEGVVLVMNGIR